MSETTSFVWFAIDAALTYLINSFSGKTTVLDGVMIILSLVGVPAMGLFVVALWWVKDDRSQTRHHIISAGLALGSALAFNQTIILFIQRSRPYLEGVTQLIVSPSTDPSFPSDHASAAFAIAFAFLFCGDTRRGKWLAAFASLVGLSRVFVGTHYVGDVVGGAFTAAIAASVVCILYQAVAHTLSRISQLK